MKYLKLLVRLHPNGDIGEPYTDEIRLVLADNELEDRTIQMIYGSSHRPKVIDREELDKRKLFISEDYIRNRMKDIL